MSPHSCAKCLRFSFPSALAGIPVSSDEDRSVIMAFITSHALAVLGTFYISS